MNSLHISFFFKLAIVLGLITIVVRLCQPYNYPHIELPAMSQLCEWTIKDLIELNLYQ